MEAILNELKQRGHQLKVYSSMGATQAVGFFDGKFQAAHDPRLKGKATVFKPSK